MSGMQSALLPRGQSRASLWPRQRCFEEGVSLSWLGLQGTWSKRIFHGGISTSRHWPQRPTSFWWLHLPLGEQHKPWLGVLPRRELIVDSPPRLSRKEFGRRGFRTHHSLPHMPFWQKKEQLWHRTRSLWGSSSLSRRRSLRCHWLTLEWRACRS